MISSNYFYLTIVICFHTVTWYQVTKKNDNIDDNSHLMYIEDIKLFAKNEKGLETLIQIIRIYSQYIGMEFDMEKLQYNGRGISFYYIKRVPSAIILQLFPVNFLPFGLASLRTFRFPCQILTFRFS